MSMHLSKGYNYDMSHSLFHNNYLLLDMAQQLIIVDGSSISYPSISANNASRLQLAVFSM